MSTNIYIMNMSESRIQKNRELREFFSEKEGWDPEYKLSMGSVSESVDPKGVEFWDLDDQNNTRVFENGIKISLERKAVQGIASRSVGMVDEGDSYDATPSEHAEIYIFDTGEVFYVHRGYYVKDFTEYTGIKGFEFDTEPAIKKLDERLGKEIVLEEVPEEGKDLFSKLGKKFVEKKNSQKQDLMDKKIKTILDSTHKDILSGNYTERHFLVPTLEPTLKAADAAGKGNDVAGKSVDSIGKRTEEAGKPLDVASTIVEQPTNTIDLEWCRKAKYQVQIELGCYKLDESHPLLPGFESKTFEQDGVAVNYAVKSGTNELEGNSWTTNPDRPYILTGTVGERWPVKPSNLSAYEVNPEDIGVVPMPISTKDPSDQEFLVAAKIPLDKHIKIISKWAYKDDGTIDESQVLTTNLEDSKISHGEGDYIVAKHIDGEPEYMELPEEVRNTKEAATKYSPRIINGSVMETTYDHAKTQEEIKEKYKSSGLSM